MLRSPIAIALVGLLALPGCKPDKPESRPAQGVTTQKADDANTEVVARVGDRLITLDEFERRLNQQSPFARSRYNSLQRKKEFLDSMVRFELLAIDAAAKGFDQDPDVQLAHKQAMVKKLTAEEIRGLVKVADIADADIAAYYQEHIDEFDKPAEVRGSHILMKDEAAAKGVLAEVIPKIEADPRRARQIFADFVRLHSVDEKTKRLGGDLQFFGKPGETRLERTPDQPDLPKAVADAIFGLEKVGAVHPAVIQSEAGWHIVQKTGFRRPYKRALEDVRTSIRNKLFRVRKGKAMEAYVQDLKAKAAVKVDEAVLDKAKVDPVKGPTDSLAPPFLRPGAGGMPGGKPGAIPGLRRAPRPPAPVEGDTP